MKPSGTWFLEQTWSRGLGVAPRNVRGVHEAGGRAYPPGRWYVSNVSIIFYCSMLLYYLFWMLLGLFLHFYIIFGTNLLTGGPAKNCCFLPISEFRRKRISNGVQTEWNLWERDFWNKRDPEDLESTSRNQPGDHEAGGRALHPCGAHVAPLTYIFLLYIYLRTPKPTEASTKT